ncbi:MAG TPA: hypothetical protein VGQ99_23425 [Tepidisphaeraceae bacterium]|nr:hypothetical protein [Tepidisphaeraceae bacterium]
MSTAAPTKQQATSNSGGYEVARPQGRCTVCNNSIAPATKYVAALAETPAGFGRIDCCLNCWPQQDRKDVVAFWQTLMPRAEQKKRVFVDDAVLCELFERLGTVTEMPKLSFRFVLGLILMRKRLVLYESTRMDHEREIWMVRMKGRDDMLDLLNPRLDEAQIREVSQQLGEILHQEL